MTAATIVRMNSSADDVAVVSTAFGTFASISSIPETV